ncbi:hypothetical protein BDU57DRAFT_538818 [Ampelomyces quisqualis]|uniref:Uncharacterized protein n=1 Tax=Ampelomyces quisqualis TaxID=50730 RepID=A0A6A5QNX9_AMPQU|nr:hypothetical protein BDU57DRAFT_538818 [Ampelomyces quisqualis]
MSKRYARSVSSTSALAAIAVAAVAADPTITAPAILPRQNDAQFIGWVDYSGSWYSETCNAGLTWYQDGKYGQCCPATLASCYAPTACVSGSLIYPYSDLSSKRTIACTEDFTDAALSICNTAFIFENMSDSAPKTDIICGSQSVNWSYYRKIPASATVISSNAPLSIPQPNPSASEKKNGESEAYIAGAVVGPILGLALICALVWFLLHHRKNKRTAPREGSAGIATAKPTQIPAEVEGYTDAKPQLAQQQQPGFDQNQYASQGAYAIQQSHADTSGSPALHNLSFSPPPRQPYHGNNVKDGYMGAPHNGSSDFGGERKVASGAHATTPQPAAELDGQSRRSSAGLFCPLELPTTQRNSRPT